MSKKLETMDAETLMTTPMEPLKFIVSGLLPEGLHVLAGSPKITRINPQIEPLLQQLRICTYFT